MDTEFLKKVILLFLTFGLNAFASKPTHFQNEYGEYWTIEKISAFYICSDMPVQMGILAATPSLDKPECDKKDIRKIKLSSDEAVVVYHSPRGYRRISRLLTNVKAQNAMAEFLASCSSGKGECPRRSVRFNEGSSKAAPQLIFDTSTRQVSAENEKREFTVNWECYAVKNASGSQPEIPDKQAFKIIGNDITGYDFKSLIDFFEMTAKDNRNYSDCLFNLEREIKNILAMALEPDCLSKECRLQIKQFRIALDGIMSKASKEIKADRYVILGDLPKPLTEMLSFSRPNTCDLVPLVNPHFSDIPSNVIITSKQFIYENLPLLEEQASPSCKGTYIKMVLSALTEWDQKCWHVYGKKCHEEYEKDAAPIVEEIKKILSKQKMSYAVVTDLLGRVNCHAEDSLDQRFYHVFKEAQETLACVQPKVGEIVDVGAPSASKPYSFTGVPTSYQLKRTSADSFDIAVPVFFVPSSKDQMFKKKANECLAKISQTLGSSDQKLNIKLSEPINAIPVHRIETFEVSTCKTVKAILAKGYGTPAFSDQDNVALKNALPSNTDVSYFKDRMCGRANSGSWSDKDACSTITHEVLHLLGLVDEYSETSMGYRMDPKSKKPVRVMEKVNGDSLQYLNYNCRIETRSDSIMNNIDDAFQSLGLNENGDPIPGITPQRKSLLFSGQFNVILYPGCRAMNDRYYACAKFAYKSSWEMKGDQMIEKGCPNPKLREECENMKWIGK